MAIGTRINRQTSRIINAMNVNTILNKTLSFVTPNTYHHESLRTHKGRDLKPLTLPCMNLKELHFYYIHAP